MSSPDFASNQSDVAALRHVLLKRPEEAWIDSSRVSSEWAGLGYRSEPDLERALDEYGAFCEILRRAGAEISFLPVDSRTGLDSLYVRDAAVACEAGLILCRMGKPARRGEPDALGEEAARLGVSVLGPIRDPGRVEGGDVVWLDSRTLAVGLGYRTNEEGIRQLRALLGDSIDELLVVALPHWRGPDDVFHLMSILSPLDEDLLLVHSPLLPVPFRESLLARGFDLLDVAEDEFDTLGCNVLAVGPRQCLSVAGNPKTLRGMQRAGVEVFEFQAEEICLKGAGGPTCLSRPWIRGSVKRGLS